MTYQDRWALVTGASSGIGRAYALELARMGASVAVTARREDALHEVAKEIQDMGREAMVIPADLSDPNAPFELIAAIDEAGHSIDILINNAGYALAGGFAGSSWSGQERFLQVMVEAPVAFAHAVLPNMLSRGFGRIINVASIAGLTPGGATHSLYGGSKALLVNFSQSLAAETEGKDVKVSACCPGIVITGIYNEKNRRAVEKLPSFMRMEADEVVRKSLVALEKDKTVYVPGLWNKFLVALARKLPMGMAEELMKKQSKMFQSRNSSSSGS